MSVQNKMAAPSSTEKEKKDIPAKNNGISTACAKLFPVAGGASSLAFAVNVMNPKLFLEYALFIF